MIKVKTLSGDIIELEASNKKEFEYKFKEKYIKEKFRPFITITFLEKDDEKDDEIQNIIINVHNILPFMENDKFFPEQKWKFLSGNEHPEAVKMILEKFKKQIEDEDEDGDIDFIDDITDKEHASQYLQDLLIKKIKDGTDVGDSGIFEGLACNSDTKVLELLFKFESQFENNQYVWNNLASNKNPLALNKIIAKMNRDKSFKEWFHFCEIGFNTNKESILFLLEHIELIEKCDCNCKNGKIKYNFSGNPYATSFLIKNKDKIDWKLFSKNNNPYALELLKKHEKKINIENLALNQSKEAMKFLEDLLINNKVDDFKSINKYLHQNPFAIPILCNYYSHDKSSYKFLKESPVLWNNSGIFCPDIESEDIYL